MKFHDLVKNILAVHHHLHQTTTKAIDLSLTIRNWLVGFYIERYERQGQDRARYGQKLMDAVSIELSSKGMDRCDRRELYRYRNFYLAYPHFVETLSPLLRSAQRPRLSGGSIVETLSPQLAKAKKSSVKELLQNLSFSHFAELIEISEPSKRYFYEQETVAGNWSVRELKRQIGSLYFERSHLSKNKEKLAKLVQSKTEKAHSHQVVRDPYVFEFLGLKSKEVASESQVEDSLLDKLQDFLLELGKGFCFEARQKRITIGGEYYFIDLVFYHRILKCNIILELKVDHFKHEHLGQLNTYVNWYKKHEMSPGDNPPLGILLCTEKNHALVQYALAGMNNRLFVSKYKLQLPKQKEIQTFMEKQLLELSGSQKK